MPNPEDIVGIGASIDAEQAQASLMAQRARIGGSTDNPEFAYATQRVGISRALAGGLLPATDDGLEGLLAASLSQHGASTIDGRSVNPGYGDLADARAYFQSHPAVTGTPAMDPLAAAGGGAGIAPPPLPVASPGGFDDGRVNYTPDAGAEAERRRWDQMTRRPTANLVDERDPYQRSLDLKADLTRDLNNRYTEGGQFAQIGSESYKEDLGGVLRGAGLAPPHPSEIPWGERARESLGSETARFNYGYSAMYLGQEAGQAFAAQNRGAYLTPEQQASSDAGLAGGMGGLLGTIIGAATPVGALAGGFVGQGVGAGVTAVVGAEEERAQATRQAAEALANSFGQGADKVREFTNQLEQSGAAVQSVGEVIKAFGSVGFAGPQSGSVLAGLSATLGEYAPGVASSVAGTIARSPDMAGMGTTMQSRLSGNDYMGVEAVAAASGDFEGVQEARRGAMANAGPVSRQYNALKTEHDRLTTFSVGQFVADLNPLQALRDEFSIGFDENAMPLLKGRADTEQAAQASFNTKINSLTEAAEGNRGTLYRAGVQFAQAGTSVEASMIGGRNLDELNAATSRYSEAVPSLRAENDSYIASLQSVYDALPADQTKARQDLQDKISSARTAGQGLANTALKANAAAFGIGESAAASEYSGGQSEAGLALTRALIEGRGFSGTGAEQSAIISEQQQRAAYLDRTAATSDFLNPAGRAEYRAEAAGLRAAIPAEQHEYQMRGEQENLGRADVGIGRGQFAVQQAELYSGPQSYATAFSQEADAYKAKIQELNEELRRGGLTVEERTGKEQQLTAARASLGALPAAEASAYYSNVIGTETTRAGTAATVGGTAEIYGGSAAGLASFGASLSYLDAAAGDARRAAQDPRLAGNPQRQAELEGQAAEAESARVGNIVSMSTYRPTPQLAAETSRVEGQLARMNMTLMEPGDINETRAAALGNIRTRLAGLNDLEAKDRKTMNAADFGVAEENIESQRQTLLTDEASTRSSMFRQWAQQLPGITVGGPSFERRYLPSDADTAANLESHGHGELAYWNYGSFKPETARRALSPMGDLPTAGAGPAGRNPGNQSQHVIATLGPTEITIHIPGLGSFPGTLSAGSPVTNRNAGMGAQVPGTPY